MSKTLCTPMEREKAQADEKHSWEQIANELADEHGLAIVVVEGESSLVVSKSNNNSICEHLYPSAQFSSCCDKYCGKAFESATSAGETVHIKCHADLNFLAVPIQTKEKQLVAIVGRSYAKTGDYRHATERSCSGDWQQFPPEKFFSNVFISASVEDLQPLAKRIEKLRDQEKEALLKFERISSKLPERIYSRVDNGIAGETANSLLPDKAFSTNLAQGHEESIEPAAETVRGSRRKQREIAELIKWRSIFGSLLNQNYKDACATVLRFLQDRYQIFDAVWLERREQTLGTVSATGMFKNEQVEIAISPDDKRLMEAVTNETSIAFRARNNGHDKTGLQMIRLFPIALGNDIRAALIVGNDLTGENSKRQITRFVQNVAPKLEILRLREENERQTLLTDAVRKFNRRVGEISDADVWEFLAQTSVELMRGERGSLLAFDDATESLVVKAAVGNQADVIKRETRNVGEKVARKVLQGGTPLVIEDILETEIPCAPESRNYKTRSFISYPITIENRQIAVFNVTDKVDGKSFDDSDLQLLNTFAPQLAVALDRTALKLKAGEFEQLSITDPLTGLLNRRYLEARLAEEIKRWERDGFPSSFMMIDVDDFKAYNDNFTHPEGDKALKLVAGALKANLRGADVAARYGGEEFSILLPQTTMSEAHIIAERIRERVERTQFPNRPVTVSIGIASSSPQLATPESLISAADEALYEAKRAGRNNVKGFPEI